MEIQAVAIKRRTRLRGDNSHRKIPPVNLHARCAMKLRITYFALFGIWLVLTCLAVGSTGRAQQVSSDSPTTLPPWVLHAKINQEVTPEYPKGALDQRIQGDITIDVVVDPEGNVSNATLVDNRANNPLLSEAALQAVKKWSYYPALINRKPVASWVVIRFRIADKPEVQIL